MKHILLQLQELERGSLGRILDKDVKEHIAKCVISRTAKGTDFQIEFQDPTLEPFDKIIWDVIHLIEGMVLIIVNKICHGEVRESRL